MLERSSLWNWSWRAAHFRGSAWWKAMEKPCCRGQPSIATFSCFAPSHSDSVCCWLQPASLPICSKRMLSFLLTTTCRRFQLFRRKRKTNLSEMVAQYVAGDEHSPPPKSRDPRKQDPACNRTLTYHIREKIKMQRLR